MMTAQSTTPTPRTPPAFARMAALVQRMLDLHCQLAGAPRREHERIILARQVEATDRQIDVLVYELYVLTEAEIGIEKAASK